MTTLVTTSRLPVGFGTGWIPALAQGYFDEIGKFGDTSRFDILETGRDSYRITLDVAGYDQDELTVETHPDRLVVSGRQFGSDLNDASYRRQFSRSFRRSFHLPRHLRATDAWLENGLLRVDLVRDVPQSMKPHRIAISRPGVGNALGRFASKAKALLNRAIAKMS